jgi:signal transduction histidine kinase
MRTILSSQGVTIERALDIAGERVIAISRVVLALGGLLAVYLDPTQPSHGLVGYTSLAGYVLFALALLVASYRLARGHWTVICHGIEIALICLIISSTEGPSSPFFVYFTFALLVAALRWQGRGVLITGGLLAVVLVGLSVIALQHLKAQADVDGLILRNIYLLVASILIAFLGDELGRSHQRMERLRFARELHDGILQTLSAARMKIHAATSLASGGQRQFLQELGDLLQEEQRHVRAFVEQSRNDGPTPDRQDVPYPVSELQPYVEYLKRLWSCEIDLAISPEKQEVPSHLSGALKLIVAESVANAVAHGAAKKINIAIAQEHNALQLKIKDNGRGLPNAKGTYELDQLSNAGLGPRSLRERITALGGFLRLITSSQGVELQIELPLAATS